MITALQEAEIEYRMKKYELKHMKADFLLNVDWKAINSERESIGLPELTNEKGRNAYIDNMFKDDELSLIKKELAYKHLQNLFDKELFEWNNQVLVSH